MNRALLVAIGDAIKVLAVAGSLTLMWFLLWGLVRLMEAI